MKADGARMARGTEFEDIKSISEQLQAFSEGLTSLKDQINAITVDRKYYSQANSREIDLIKEMGPQRKKNRIAAVMNTPCEGLETLCDYQLVMDCGKPMENVLLGFEFITFAQTLAVLKSLSLGITPDNPCPTGEVNRVVKGVTLYPYKLK